MKDVTHAMIESHIEVVRTARYWSMGGDDGSVDEVWFLLHGYGQLASHLLRSCRPLAGETRRLIAPEALSRFYVRGTYGAVGASWMTKEDRDAEIADNLRYLDALRDDVLAKLPTTPRVVVLGFSQGAASAARWALRGAHEPDGLILWGGHLPPEIDLAAESPRLARMGLRVVIGDQDEYISPEQAATERARLAHHGLDAGWVEYHGGHRIEGEVLGGLGERIEDREKSEERRVKREERGFKMEDGG